MEGFVRVAPSRDDQVVIHHHGGNSTMHATLDETQIVLLRCLYAADHLLPGQLHDWRELLGRNLDDLPDHWLDETYEDLRALGFLHEHAGRAFGGAVHGGLSAQGRWFEEGLDAADDPA
jgi:hypothetical protein